ncbi:MULTISPECIES: biliverdin-producing heme oxygenase [unclassified Chelatococcus]|uniref:biliverdin-producing heme oxygenase n=1 Tax=unclassified Chelatococcus TaxID=2638111 RepID=UPI001BCB3E6F|nr:MULTISPECIES: biliverdin-producing heme oxygenase [unclassified Chelatococcus]MBS7737687.1 biliverdin-producing heme oxygenase [Chelatococcus sp. HY11]MBX3544179.1 biliverdin-producing heme oxygenase [Chelatococcus sp.]MCO5079499.1 biliverdin-producing heme oxygenase [Chelatococcus sp.]
MSELTRRFILREKTSLAHARVDALVGTFERREDYTRYIRGMAKFRLPVEHRLDLSRWPEAWGPWRPRMIGHVLRQDLLDLGLPDVEPAAALPKMRTEAELLGTLYVLLGSNLGAQILQKRANAIGLSDCHGARHLAVQASGLDDWRAFTARLDQVEHIDIEATIEASLATFREAELAFGASAPTSAAHARPERLADAV